MRVPEEYPAHDRVNGREFGVEGHVSHYRGDFVPVVGFHTRNRAGELLPSRYASVPVDQAERLADAIQRACADARSQAAVSVELLRSTRGKTVETHMDDDTYDKMFAELKNAVSTRRWHGVLARVDEVTGDGRVFVFDPAFSHSIDGTPRPLRAVTRAGVVVCGAITTLAIDGHALTGTGWVNLDEVEEYREELLKSTVTVGVDLVDCTIKRNDSTTNFTRWRVLGATLSRGEPAWPEVFFKLDDDGKESSE